ncbi:hypothetical protein QEH52_01635 [Coraliomargarita sp. SDUM461003]|uniref:Uncharacterized protein n=1 Tax=Thalassobacterium maritimum TaxID=3041265 RepID=A0ABU1AQ76_9BACT|nr:hypothetical protein [Coraliomargarita sp. SDUM461003]MDQ8206193.1 hypothetical protein [Coraliomargarita sp. SDUM461003]
MLTHERVKQVMRDKHCSYTDACRWLGQRGAAARADRKRAAARKEELLRRDREMQRACGID